ncbi:MAG TPA: segregation/condensation protein A [Kiritimatiellia bacterium]|nr:segregation/condensation protein A [Kiritimatiellia bacterium]HNR93275.1 segregation/condensation protein A [Kiritimatiellia bacterium]HNS80252.1 segregation/condensation protein A [Kiritimatiellia bacterium]
MSEDYKVQLEVFEGPLDLLLYLIKKDEVDIYDIPIELITRQYLQYMELMKMLDLNIAGDFLVMAATLMMIKSRMLLPAEDRPEMEEEEEDDPRWDLVRQLVEYKKFKDVAGHLQMMEFHMENVFTREGGGIQLGPDTDRALQDVSIFDLISAFDSALKRIKQEDLREIFAERFTVGDKIDYIIGSIRSKKRIIFSSLFEGMATRHEIVCTFLALLELIRLKQIRAEQAGRFEEIAIVATDDAELAGVVHE